LTDVSVGELESLLAKKIGDPVRLKSIINTMKKGKKYSDSDEMFIEHLLSIKDSPKSIPKTSPETADHDLVITTTNYVEGYKIEEYLDIVSGEAVMGANLFRDLFASVTDIIGGRSGQYEGRFRRAKEIALDEMEEEAEYYGANAIVGVDVVFVMVRESMMMVSAYGTAVKIVPEKKEKITINKVQ